MARFRNDFNDPPEQYVDDRGEIAERPAVRVAITQGWVGVPPGGEVEVPDEEYEHWVAGGWTPLTPKPAPAAVAAPATAATDAQSATTDQAGAAASTGSQTAAEGSDPQ